MLGRGLFANPLWLVMRVKGGPAATALLLSCSPTTRCLRWCRRDWRQCGLRMKEKFYAKCAFADPATVHKIVRKTKSNDEYRAAVEHVFGDSQAAPTARFHG